MTDNTTGIIMIAVVVALLTGALLELQKKHKKENDE